MSAYSKRTAAFCRTSFGLALALGCGVACSSAPRPVILGEVDAAQQSVRVKEASPFAPQAHAEAQLLAKRANAAHAAGDFAGAQILAEQALVAYERAVLEARRAKAEQKLAQNAPKLQALTTQLAELEAEERRVIAETDELDLRVKVARDALPLPSNEKANPAREQARREAARGLALQARLLCASARLLAPERTAIAPLIADLDKLAGKLVAAVEAVPIDEAVRLRSACQKELTEVRRSALLKEPGAGKADALLAELSAGGLLPFRDDRGVVVTLRGIFTPSNALAPQAVKAITELAQVAKAHAALPVLVVVHQASGPATNTRTRGEAVLAKLKLAGLSRVALELAGADAPLLPRDRKGAAERNERTEVVFVVGAEPAALSAGTSGVAPSGS